MTQNNTISKFDSSKFALAVSKPYFYNQELVGLKQEILFLKWAISNLSKWAQTINDVLDTIVSSSDLTVFLSNK